MFKFAWDAGELRENIAQQFSVAEGILQTLRIYSPSTQR